MLRVDRRGMVGLLVANLMLAGCLLSLPWVGTLIGDPARAARTASWPIRALVYSRSAVIGTAVSAVLLALLTAVEACGVMFFGRRRGWRITSAIAWQVCAHASIGWIIAAAFTLLSLIIWLNLSFFGFGGALERSGRTADLLLALVPLAGFFAGMLVFESLVYLGVRRCRYANAPRAGAAADESARQLPSGQPSAAAP